MPVNELEDHRIVLAIPHARTDDDHVVAGRIRIAACQRRDTGALPRMVQLHLQRLADLARVPMSAGIREQDTGHVEYLIRVARLVAYSFMTGMR